ncbi:MAG: carboxypeptidase regulatory-like domain-containing protein, partial [Chitinispirillaceae bacterium]|nr:carboxypeptidase regulatory-like domain-containing protein [Chitinispirillaceae bacterium]
MIKPVLKNSAFILCAALAGAICVCTGMNPLAAGGGTETIIGRVVDSAGIAAPGTRVALLPENYNPVTGLPAPAYAFIDTTGDSGTYSFSKVPYGGYTITALHLSTQARALRRGISIARNLAPSPVDTLRIPGAIGVSIPDSADTLSGYIYIPGTDIAVRITAGTGKVLVGTVPAGIIPSVNYTVADGSAQRVVRYAVPVTSGDTVDVENPGWKYAKRLYLNTTASGA